MYSDPKIFLRSPVMPDPGSYTYAIRWVRRALLPNSEPSTTGGNAFTAFWTSAEEPTAQGVGIPERLKWMTHIQANFNVFAV